MVLGHGGSAQIMLRSPSQGCYFYSQEVGESREGFQFKAARTSILEQNPIHTIQPPDMF